ncbi:hypothetical protein pEaSNUABM42_00022 [Erwinia phage pEa_SNUABM_42]|nr:hypothetical protein pEaSNUABM43_00022 [Erwinia phage pEa_SNUABM_43]QVW55339.1 hypothetical protein pEaSNUABM42_00022 [Erwinia phage pEa_SNUABM_42]
MKTTLRPMDVILAHPDTLSKIAPQSELDRRLLESLEWGFTLHPDEVSNTRVLDVSDSVVIDWTEREGCDDVREYVAQATVPPRVPIAGLAEHTISLRRLCNAQDEIVRNGEAWSYGTASHLKNVLLQA